MRVKYGSESCGLGRGCGSGSGGDGGIRGGGQKRRVPMMEAVTGGDLGCREGGGWVEDGGGMSGGD